MDYCYLLEITLQAGFANRLVISTKDSRVYK